MPTISYTVTKEVDVEFLASIASRADYAFAIMTDPYIAEGLFDPDLVKVTMTFGDEPKVVYDFDKLRAVYEQNGEASDE